ncbi:MAG: TIGR02757 family protein [Bacteroidetes bacterium]|nr:MAG: TIGR02757 family protein [Bacteroidota bacterium]
MEKLKIYLDSKANQFNKTDFISNDPIQIPHGFSKMQDVEISAFFASILAWGLRKTIINKCKELMNLMENSPHDFIVNHQIQDLKRFLNFKHRTFNADDLLYFIYFLKFHYSKNYSLENAFSQFLSPEDQTVEKALIGFEKTFFAHEHLIRTKKHIATPSKQSACKRINMFLRWMVRSDDQNVDFGIWKAISPAQLLCPLDVHVDRIARNLGLLTRPQSDWKAVLELTENLRKMKPEDPVFYDFALFGIGIENK